MTQTVYGPTIRQHLEDLGRKVLYREYELDPGTVLANDYSGTMKGQPVPEAEPKFFVLTSGKVLAPAANSRYYIPSQFDLDTYRIVEEIPD